MITVCDIKGHLKFPFEITLNETETIINGEGTEITVMGSLTLKNVQNYKIKSSFRLGDGLLFE